MASQEFSITEVPTDVAVGLSLADGDYIVQNLSGVDVYLSKTDAPLSDPTTLRHGHVMPNKTFLGIAVDSGNAFYSWTPVGAGLLEITEVA